MRRDHVSSDGAAPEEISVRPAQAEDRPEMIELCRSALGWGVDDPSERFFSWKHDENPFGPSPAWIAEVDGVGMVGVRVFMRWQFRDGADTVPAVRAVDTATHPDMQGMGIFRTLTLGALPDLETSGIGLVFNTPNDKSRPGYLKMGWEEVGRVPVAARPRSVRSIGPMRGARAAAQKWSEPTSVGLSAPEAFADTVELELLLANQPPSARLHTDRSAAYLQWRYSFDALHYRVVPLGDRLADGVVVFRLRRRGTALEAAISEVIDPTGRRSRAAISWLLRRSGADYAIRCAGAGSTRTGFVPAPRLGPVLTWRPLARRGVPRLSQLDLSLGDVELF